MAYHPGTRTHTNNVKNKLSEGEDRGATALAHQFQTAFSERTQMYLCMRIAHTTKVRVVVGVEVGVIGTVDIEPVLIVSHGRVDSSLTRSSVVE